jgi:hypothetical protein
MIKIKQPALAINAHRVPGADYQMEQTFKLPKNATAQDVVNAIQTAAANTGGKFLENVVINSHGSPGYIHIGETTGIGIEHVGLFGGLKNSVGTIWIVACKIAGHSMRRFGDNFCSQLAQNAGCSVVGSNVSQWVDIAFYLRFCPKNCIDNYEGQVFRWDQTGKKEDFKP